MLTLYHCHNARSFRPLWTLEEMGLSYELKMLPFPPRQLAPDYLSINPLGTVPAFFDGDMRMTESSAICEYLVTRYGPTPLAVAPTEAGFRPLSQLALFRRGDADVPADPRAALFAAGAAGAPLGAKSRRIIPAGFCRGLRAVDAVVSRQPTLCAGRFTVADISVGFALTARRTHRPRRQVLAGGRGLLAIAQGARRIPPRRGQARRGRRRTGRWQNRICVTAKRP